MYVVADPETTAPLRDSQMLKGSINSEGMKLDKTSLTVSLGRQYEVNGDLIGSETRWKGRGERERDDG